MLRKKLGLLIITLLALQLTSCKKEQGCTDTDALNYSSTAEEDDGSCTYPPMVDEDPTIEILKPSINQELQRTLEVSARFKDDVALELATFIFSSEEFGGNTYHLETRELDGMEQTVDFTINLLETPLAGSHILSVRCTDEKGNNVFLNHEFILEDSMTPEVWVDGFPESTEDNTIEFAIDVFDAGGLVKVEAEFWATEFAGFFKFDEQVDEFATPQFKERTINYSFTNSSPFPGPYEVRLKAYDHEGNIYERTLEGEKL